MEAYKCHQCQFFRQHYGLDDKKIFRVYCGHCTQGRKPRRKPDQIACDAFVLADKKDPFVTKEYLSKELLRYVLEMELLPEVLDVATGDWELG